MASEKNDRLFSRTIEGSLNYYDNQRCCATAADKGLAARLGGHSYNILSNTDKHEIYFRDLRHDEHFVDQKGAHTIHWFGCRRGKFPPRHSVIKETIVHPDAHPREHALAQRRSELQLAQVDHPSSYRSFRERCQPCFPPNEPKRYSISGRRYASEAEQPRTSDKATWQQRRSEGMSQSSSAPILTLTAPAGSFGEASQRQTESLHASQRQPSEPHRRPLCKDSGARSTGTGAKGEMQGSQRSLSLTRVENHDFAVSKKNNHFSQQDKLTRGDPYFARPKLAVTNSSVKYDIVSNERKWFSY